MYNLSVLKFDSFIDTTCQHSMHTCSTAGIIRDVSSCAQLLTCQCSHLLSSLHLWWSDKRLAAGAADAQAVPALPAPQMPAQPLHQQLIKPDEATLYQQTQQADAEQSDTPVQLPSTSAARAEAGQADETEPMDDEEESEPDIAQLQVQSVGTAAQADQPDTHVV